MTYLDIFFPESSKWHVPPFDDPLDVKSLLPSLSQSFPAHPLPLPRYHTSNSCYFLIVGLLLLFIVISLLSYKNGKP